MKDTPKDKAEELFETYYDLTPLNAKFSDTAEIANTKILMDRRLAKDLSTICVDEVVKQGNYLIADILDGYVDVEFNTYWQEVKNEIEKL